MASAAVVCAADVAAAAGGAEAFETREELHERGFESGDAGADDADVDFEEGPAVGDGLVVWFLGRRELVGGFDGGSGGNAEAKEIVSGSGC